VKTDKELRHQFAYHTRNARFICSQNAQKTTMPLHILGLNHNTAPVEIREQVVYSGDAVASALHEVRQLPGVDEAVVLSTCNRTELYFTSASDGCELAKQWLIDDQKLNGKSQEALFSLRDEEAVRHLFRVACGLDSMVLGEPQILGQLKDAFRMAEDAGAVGSELHRMFRHTYSVAKKVRTDTAIGANPVSVAYAAVNLANQFFAGFSKHTAVLIGAGVTIDLVAKHLTAKNIGRLFVANRSLDNAREIASRYDGFALPISELQGTLPEADILVSSTASPDTLLSAKDMSTAMQSRKRRPVFAVDLAVPRDLDPAISALDDVFLYTIDDLDKVIDESQSHRAAAAVDAEQILNDETRRYLEIERGKTIVPAITALRDHGDGIRREVVREAQRRLAKGVPQEEVVDYVAAALLKKILHNPSVCLREAGENQDQQLIDAVKRVFGLKSDDWPPTNKQ